MFLGRLESSVQERDVAPASFGISLLSYVPFLHRAPFVGPCALDGELAKLDLGVEDDLFSSFQIRLSLS